MTRCSVPACYNNNADHKFPKDARLRKRWLKAIEREDFVPKSGARICRKHFHRSDYVKIGLHHQNKYLKKSAVPSIFPWNKNVVSDPYTTQQRNRHQASESFDNTQRGRQHCGDDVEEVDREFSSQTTLVSRSINDPHLKKLKTQQLTKETQTSTCSRLLTTEQILSDDESVRFYTGLDSYAQFTLLLSTLLPMANDIKYRSKRIIILTAEDQFLMLLIKLRRGKPDFEIGKMFGVSRTDVANIIVTWLSFVTDYWSLLDCWPKKNIIHSYMPLPLRLNCPSNGIILNAEIPIKKENCDNVEKSSFSQYKLKKTMKFLAECTSNGLITYCLETRAISKGNLQIRDDSPISGVMRLNQDLAKSIPIEKLIACTKMFKILGSTLNQSYAPLSPKIFSVCLLFCSIKVGIVTVNP